MHPAIYQSTKFGLDIILPKNWTNQDIIINLNIYQQLNEWFYIHSLHKKIKAETTKWKVNDPGASTSDSIEEDGQEVILSRMEMEGVHSIGFHGLWRNEGHCCIFLIRVQSYESLSK